MLSKWQNIYLYVVYKALIGGFYCSKSQGSIDMTFYFFIAESSMQLLIIIIAVGSVILLIIIAVAVIYFIRRRKSHKQGCILNLVQSNFVPLNKIYHCSSKTRNSFNTLYRTRVLFEGNVGNKCFFLTGITHAEILSTVWRHTLEGQLICIHYDICLYFLDFLDKAKTNDYAEPPRLKNGSTRQLNEDQVALVSVFFISSSQIHEYPQIYVHSTALRE